MLLLRLQMLVWVFLPMAVFLSHAGPPEDPALVRLGENWRYTTAFAGTGDWNKPGFDDSKWREGPSGFSIGYGSYDESTPLPYGQGSAYFLRKSFVVEDVSALSWLVLRIDYRDGFVAFLNGVEIARRGFPLAETAPVAFNQQANFKSRDVPEEIDLTGRLSLVKRGTNLLAIQVHSAAFDGYGIACVPELLANFVRGPFVQNATTQSIHVGWRTPGPCQGVVEFGPTTNLENRVVSAVSSTNHAVLIQPLLPGTRYFYRVNLVSTNGVRAASAISSFVTLKASGGFRLGLLGDTGTGSLAQYRIADLMSWMEPDLVLHAGDIIYPSFTTGLADMRCFSVYARHMRSTPYFFAIGNHDLYSGIDHYRKAFILPTNPVTGTDDYYSFDHGDAHVAVLFVPYLDQHTPVPGDAQHRWLEADLATTTKPWKIIMMHNPMMSSSLHRFDDQNGNFIPDREEIKNFVLPLASKYGVQLVVSGHEHVYERFSPLNGVHAVTSGGGGVLLYKFTAPDADSAQFQSTHNGVLITATNDVMRIQAFDELKNEIDRFVISKSAPAPTNDFAATWASPAVESTPANDFDGNVDRQEFALRGVGVPSRSGLFSNLGELRVNNDERNLYLGLSGVMIKPGQDVLLFLESSSLPGVESMTGIGNGVSDPAGQGTDALDALENLAFLRFKPSLGFILGDEFGDGANPAFLRAGSVRAMGQGAYWLRTNLPAATGIRIQQFNRSPQASPVFYEQNADFIELQIPLEILGPLKPGGVIKIGAVVGMPVANTSVPSQFRELDSGFVGLSFQNQSTNRSVLEPLTFRRASGLFPPANFGLRAESISSGGIRISWQASPGLARLQFADTVEGPYADLPASAQILQTNGDTQSALLQDSSSRTRFFRLLTGP